MSRFLLHVKSHAHQPEGEAHEPPLHEAAVHGANLHQRSPRRDDFAGAIHESPLRPPSPSTERGPGGEVNPTPYISLQDVTKVYAGPEGGVVALDSVSMDIAKGDFVAIVGPSGSGKSTLLTVLGAMNPPSRGRVVIDGLDLYHLPPERLADFRRQRMGFVFQQQHLISYLTALENVMLPLAISRVDGKAGRASRALREVGLEHRAAHLPDQLSGGEMGRVAVARAIVNDPVIILADEPTGNLDASARESILRLLRSLSEKGRTILLVTHSAEAAAAANRVVSLRDGRVVE